jgi:hypothetical protein
MVTIHIAYYVLKNELLVEKFLLYDTALSFNEIIKLYNYHSSGFYPFSCLVLKTQSETGICLRIQAEPI